MFVNNHASGDGQALPGTLASCLGCKECLEYPLLDGFGNSTASVADANLHAVCFPPSRYADFAELGARFCAAFYGVSGIDDDI